MSKILQLPSHFTPTHQTGGLPGFPAIDVFAPGGTLVASPVTGEIIKLSGHPTTPTTQPGGPYGLSIYIKSSTGVYYLTHFTSRAKAVVTGSRVKRGQVIGRVADYTKATHGVTPSHIHEGYHNGPWTP